VVGRVEFLSELDYGIFFSSKVNVSVLGLARTGLIFTRLQEGAQPGGGG